METTSPVIGPGTVLSRFRIVEKLGKGGMGEVYRARDLTLDRDVAIKVLPSGAAGTLERRRRFETEAKAVAALSHPGIVPVFDIGESGGTPFIVQELVGGDTVEELVSRGGALPIEKVAEWGSQAADALARAHDAGIVHRDVKPGNLIVDDGERLRVLDFGLAKLMERPGRRPGDGPRITSDGLVVGTVDYMSPEQARGEEIDARSDIFSLGIVLYEMATGRRPFLGRTPVEVMLAIAHDPAGPIDAVATPVPEAFVAVLEKALEKRTDERYQSMREMSADLRRFVRRNRDASALQSVTRLAPQSFVPARPRRRRHYVVAVAALAAAIGGTLALRDGKRIVPTPPTATRAFLQSDFREEDPTFAPNGRGFVYSSNEGGEYNIYYRLFASSSPIRLTQPGGQKRQPVFSPDGGTVLFTFEDPVTLVSSIFSVPALGGPVRTIVERGEQAHVSRDGRRLLFIRKTGHRTALVVANIDGTDQRTIADGGVGRLMGARFSNDASFVAYVRHSEYPNNRGDIWRVPTEGGQPVRLTHDERDVWGHVELLPDDSAVLFCSLRSGIGTIWMVPSRGGEPKQVVPATSMLLSPSISPDGHSLLVQSRRFVSDAWEFSLADGHARQLTNCGSVWAPARLPNGSLLYGDWTRPGINLDIFLEDGQGVRTLVTVGGTPRPSADGRRVYLSADLPENHRGIVVMDVAGGPPRILTNDRTDGDDWADPTPDETKVVFVRAGAGGKRSLCAVDVATGTVTTLAEGDIFVPRATSDQVVFRMCAAGDDCGIFAVPFSGGTPRLIVPNGWYPAVSRDGKTVYAWAGQKHDSHAVSVPIDGSAPPTRLFDFNATHEVQFWAVHTLDVSPDGRSLVATRQWINDDVILLEGVFR